MEASEWRQHFDAAFEPLKRDVREAVAKYQDTRAALLPDWAAALTVWINEHVKHPLPDNWRNELDAFLDHRATLGVNVLPAERAKLQRWFARHAHRRGNLPKGDPFLVRPSAHAEAATITPEIAGPADSRREPGAGPDEDSVAPAGTTSRPEPTLPESVDPGPGDNKPPVEEDQHSQLDQPHHSPSDAGQGAETTPSRTAVSVPRTTSAAVDYDAWRIAGPNPNNLQQRVVTSPTAGEGGVYLKPQNGRTKVGSTNDFRARYGANASDGIEVEIPLTRTGPAADDSAYRWSARRQARFDEEYLDRVTPPSVRYRDPANPKSPVDPAKWDQYRHIFGYGNLPGDVEY